MKSKRGLGLQLYCFDLKWFIIIFLQMFLHHIFFINKGPGLCHVIPFIPLSFIFLTLSKYCTKFNHNLDCYHPKNKCKKGNPFTSRRKKYSTGLTLLHIVYLNFLQLKHFRFDNCKTFLPKGNFSLILPMKIVKKFKIEKICLFVLWYEDIKRFGNKFKSCTKERKPW